MTTRLQLSDLVYLGGFRVPQEPTGVNGFSFGGTALAFDPLNSGLLMVGHPYTQHVAQIVVPQKPIVGPIDSLPTAAIEQPFMDVTGGLVDFKPGDAPSASQWMIGGLLPWADRLLWSIYDYYDAGHKALVSHGYTEFDQARGPFALAALSPGYVGGSMCLVPPDWRAAFGWPVLTGLGGVPIAGRTSCGPCAVGFDPSYLGAAPCPSEAFLYYPLSNPLGPLQAQSSSWNLCSTFTGQCFISTPSGKSGWLAFGRRGTGPYWYTDNPLFPPPPGATDPWYPLNKGNHSPPYSETVWFYDPDQILQMAANKVPWQVQPYAVAQFPGLVPSGYGLVGGAAWDAATGRLFVSQLLADQPAGTQIKNPLIHVFSVT